MPHADATVTRSNHIASYSNHMGNQMKSHGSLYNRCTQAVHGRNTAPAAKLNPLQKGYILHCQLVKSQSDVTINMVRYMHTYIYIHHIQTQPQSEAVCSQGLLFSDGLMYTCNIIQCFALTHRVRRSCHSRFDYPVTKPSQYDNRITVQATSSIR